jgi:glycosyltransferase involved in cell wall biosynthesis
MQPTYSVVVPVFNEVDNLQELYARLSKVLDAVGGEWEIIVVNDGSTDGSAECLRAMQQRDPRIRVVDFARNFGHQIAVTAGLDVSRGKAVVVIDADLQDPPEVIPDLIARWKEGYEVVYAVRSKREGESWFKEATAKLFYRIIYGITEIKIPMDAGDFRLMDEKVVDVLRHMRERNRFIRGMSAWVGFRQTGVPYQRHARFAGKTKYPFSKMMQFALNAVTSFSYFPLQMATYFGFLCAAIAAVAIPVIVILRMAGSEQFIGQATTLVSVLFLGGIQLVGIGILGEYIGRIYDEVKGRPLYIERKRTASGKQTARKKEKKIQRD